MKKIKVGRNVLALVGLCSVAYIIISDPDGFFNLIPPPVAIVMGCILLVSFLVGLARKRK